MLPIQWRPEASADLATIIGYIAERNDVAALELQQDIEYAVSQLPQHPYLYRLGRAPGTREMVVHPNYLVVYQVEPAVIEIVAVVHARQQYPKMR
ncbi:type II toxin-antitoxin system RelE/ParE family toxin [Streptomyces cyaneofuscatus]|uniref:type II toxin-antitoxin system RelE/ParE family toxin n=1 Tax=Streptomyces cyaneofuscatus TaxID=66883 RepID=UPI002FF1C698